jgi:hypothetical protein
MYSMDLPMRIQSEKKRLLSVKYSTDHANGKKPFNILEKEQCCGSGIRCLFDPWTQIRDPE